jgi:hypothetical protein
MGKAIESIERHAYQQAVTGTIANPVTQQPGLSGGKKDLDNPGQRKRRTA